MKLLETYRSVQIFRSDTMLCLNGTTMTAPDWCQAKVDDCLLVGPCHEVKRQIDKIFDRNDTLGNSAH